MEHIQKQLASIERRIASNERRLVVFLRSITHHLGSLWFLIFNAVLLLGWIEWNLGLFGLPIFDPYPFSLLALVYAVEAVFLSALILINQARMSEVMPSRESGVSDGKAAMQKMLPVREDHPRLPTQPDVIHVPESRDHKHEITLDQIQREIERNSDF